MERIWHDTSFVQRYDLPRRCFRWRDLAITRVARSAGELRHLTPTFLPDGRRFLFLTVNQPEDGTAVFSGSLDSPEVKRIITNPVGPIYLVAGHLLFVRNSTVMAQPFNWKRERLTGDPVSLLERPYAYSGSSTQLPHFLRLHMHSPTRLQSCR